MAEYYLINTSRRLRERRYYADIRVGGKKIVPGSRASFSKEELLKVIDVAAQLQLAGAIDIRRTSDGCPVSAVTLVPAAPRPAPKPVEAEPAVDEPEIEMEIETPPTEEGQPASLGEIFEMFDERDDSSGVRSSMTGKPKRRRKSKAVESAPVDTSEDEG